MDIDAAVVHFFVVRILVAVVVELVDIFVGIYLVVVHVFVVRVLAAVVVVAAVPVVNIVAAKVVEIPDVVVSADVDKIVEQVLDNL